MTTNSHHETDPSYALAVDASSGADPVQHVFSIVELVTLVLSFLPEQSLLVAQRVCRTWHACINEVPELRKIAFTYLPSSTSTDRRLPFPPTTSTPTSIVDCLASLPRVNPLLVKRFCVGWEFRPDEQPVPTISPLCKWRDTLFAQPNASWRRMTITQPPVPYKLRTLSGEETALALEEGPSHGFKCVNVSMPLDADVPLGVAVERYIALAEKESDRLMGLRGRLRKPGWRKGRGGKEAMNVAELEEKGRQSGAVCDFDNKIADLVMGSSRAKDRSKGKMSDSAKPSSASSGVSQLEASPTDGPSSGM